MRLWVEVELPPDVTMADLYRGERIIEIALVTTGNRFRELLNMTGCRESEAVRRYAIIDIAPLREDPLLRAP